MAWVETWKMNWSIQLMKHLKIFSSKQSIKELISLENGQTQISLNLRNCRLKIKNNTHGQMGKRFKKKMRNSHTFPSLLSSLETQKFKDLEMMKAKFNF